MQIDGGVGVRMTSDDLALRPHSAQCLTPYGLALRESLQFSKCDRHSCLSPLFTTAISASPAKVGEGFLPILPYERQRKVTGPSIGCAIGAPVRRDSIKFAFSAKYHFAGRSASSISINRGLCFSPSACWIIVS